MNLPPSTPFPVPSFQDGDADASPAAFLQFMRKLISENLTEHSAVRPNQETWVPVVQGLSEHFLASFPLPTGLPWDTIHEKVRFTEVTLEVIERTILRVDSLFAGQGGLAKTTFIRLVNVCSILDLWAEPKTAEEGDLPSARTLRDKTFNVVVDLLRCLGSGAISSDKSSESTWETLRGILTECLGAISGLRISHSLIVTYTLLTHQTSWPFLPRQAFRCTLSSSKPHVYS